MFASPFQSLQYLHKRYLALVEIFRAYSSKGDDPFVLSRAGFSALLSDCSIDLNRSACDIIFYTATSEKSDIPEGLKVCYHKCTGTSN